MRKTEYEQGMEDMLAYVQKTIYGALDNPALNVLPAKMALQVLLASLSIEEE